MSEWQNQFDNHRIHDDIRSALTPAEAIRDSGADLQANTVEQLDRIIFVLSEIQRRLSRTDCYLIPVQPLNSLHAPLLQISNNLAQYQTNQNITHIQQAYNQIENTLVHLAQIPVPSGPEDLDAIRDSAVALRRSAGQHIHNLQEESNSALQDIQNIKNKAKSVGEQLDQLNSSMSSLVNELRDEFDANEKSRQEQHAAQEEQWKENSKAVLDEMELAWARIVEARESEYEDLYESVKTRISKAEEEYKKKADDVINEMGELRADAERIAGIITDTGMVSGYQRVADAEGRASLFWRIVAFLSLSSLVGFAVYLFVITLKPGFEVSTTLTLTRGFVGAAVAILAGFAARQADRHQRAERRHRKMELELATLSPFLSKFPDDEARKIKTDLAMKMFAQQDYEAKSKQRASNSSLMDLLEMALESLRTLSGKQ